MPLSSCQGAATGSKVIQFLASLLVQVGSNSLPPKFAFKNFFSIRGFYCCLYWNNTYVETTFHDSWPKVSNLEVGIRLRFWQWGSHSVAWSSIAIAEAQGWCDELSWDDEGRISTNFPVKKNTHERSCFFLEGGRVWKCDGISSKC